MGVGTTKGTGLLVTLDLKDDPETYRGIQAISQKIGEITRSIKDSGIEAWSYLVGAHVHDHG
jgi:hypothetical protein